MKNFGLKYFWTGGSFVWSFQRKYYYTDNIKFMSNSNYNKNIYIWTTYFDRKRTILLSLFWNGDRICLDYLMPQENSLPVPYFLWLDMNGSFIIIILYFALLSDND